MNISDLKAYYAQQYNNSTNQNSTSSTTEATSTSGVSFTDSLGSLLSVISSSETDNGEDRDSYTSTAAQAYMPTYCDTYNDILQQISQSKPVETDQYLVSSVDSSVYGGDIAITDKTTGETSYYNSDDLTVQNVDGTDLSYIVSADGESATIVDDQLKEALSSVLSKSGQTLKETTVTASDVESLTSASDAVSATATTSTDSVSQTSSGSGSSSSGSSSDDSETTTEIITMADGSRILKITTTEGDKETVVTIQLSSGTNSTNAVTQATDSSSSDSSDDATLVENASNLI